ncbi:MAG: hypothetical protein VX475_05790, partial [Myxococcota bacterium]|nr:hypothetical protein [Myxococcota bacterium]
LARDEDQLVVSINPEHPFYKKIYKPLLEEKTVSAATVRGQLELLLLSAARSVAEVSGEDEREALAEWRARWGETIATFLNG